MARSHKSRTVLLVLLVLLLGAGGASWFVLGAGPEEVVVDAAMPGAAGPREAEEELQGSRADRARLTIGSTLNTDADASATTVAWPVELSLELVRAAHMPRAKGVPAMGTGRTAAIAGLIIGKVEEGVPAEIRFVAGPNEGRVLYANDSGEFGATDLYPGSAIVRVKGPGIPGSVRDVTLRQQTETQLNISYGLPGTVHGTVYGPGNEALEGVDVELDGQETSTDENGEFFFPAMTPGTNLVLILKKEGYAHFFQREAAAAARRMARGRQVYAMRPAATLRVAIPDRVGGPGKARIVLLPANTAVARDFPWWLVSPTAIDPGGGVTIENLPPIKIAIRTFHDGALAEPADKRVTLRAGGVANETIRLKPAPRISGILRNEAGDFVPGARVVMEAPDRVGAAMFHLGEMPSFLETEVVPMLPPAARETTSDSYGRYVLSAWPNIAATQYLVAESGDGELWAGRVVPSSQEDQEIDLTLEPVDAGAGELSIEFPGRTQGLPVEVSINGDPLDPGLVPHEQPLVLEGLAEGTWRLSATWNGQPVIGGAGYQEFELRGSARQSVSLPKGAIDGQDEDTLLRTGRRGS